jgi:adenylate cyclase
MSDSTTHLAVEAGRPAARHIRAGARLLIVGAAIAAVVLGARSANVFRPVEQDSVDARFSIRGTHEPAIPIAVVAIDEATLRELGSWPIRRGWHARTIDALRADDARAIVYDIQFTEPSPSPQDDTELVEAVERARGKIVLATTEVDERGETSVLGGEPLLTNIGARVGHATIPVDEDGTMRHIPYSTNGLQTFGLVGAEIATGEKIDARALGGQRGWIDYLGPAGTVPHYSLARVAQHDIEPGTFRGKVVVIGASAPSLQDIHRTASDSRMDSPEIQANVVATALAGFPLQSAPGWVDVLLIVVCALLVPLLRLRLSLGLSLLGALAAGFVLAVGTQLAFQTGWVTSFVYPLAALVLSAIGALAVAASATTRRI